MPLLIRSAVMADLPELARVYAAAKAFMRAHGNPNQWNTVYPDPETLAEDIAAGTLFTVEESGAVRGVFALIPGPDPDYAVIDGAWIDDQPYGVIHRIASDGLSHGVFAACLAFARRSYRALRMDTHKDNRVMQALAEKNGFACCGVVHLRGVGPRMAYQWNAPSVRAD